MMENYGVPFAHQNHSYPALEKANDLRRENDEAQENKNGCHENSNDSLANRPNKDEADDQNPQEVRDLHLNVKDHQTSVKPTEEFRRLNIHENSSPGKEDSLSEEMEDLQITPAKKIFKVVREAKPTTQGKPIKIFQGYQCYQDA